MGRAALVTVPDEGAAWIVRDALAAGGVSCEVERVGLDHPYSANALARQMRIFVAEEHLAAAQRLLAALEGEVANHDEDLTAEALAAGRPEDVPGKDAPPPGRDPRISWALALGLLLPIPAVCLYARASRLGAVLLGVFVMGMVYCPPWDLQVLGFSDPKEDSVIGLIAPGAKVADLAVGIPLVALRRRRARQLAAH
jgi:hypothetical protein